MEFITVEQFKEQPSEVQKVFLDWWNNIISEYDLVQDENRVMLYKDYLERGCIENDSYPLFTEGQLRRFIEDKTGYKNLEITGNIENCEYELHCYKNISSTGYSKVYSNLGIDVLQAYWKVACMVAMEV
ncbi:MAG: hypothetical protein E7J31_09750 [Clostridium sp.]|uniref:hypothetical protein n=1 Tax=Clostridium sp. TaxID=1506 RepID=UPI00290FFFE3|nr:hypothetical protein [Clostridium sp.]MDU7948712.1 hypothetical protein [Clostridium sp.]